MTSIACCGLWSPGARAQLLGPEFQVNSHTISGQDQPAVAADDSGNFVVVWRDTAQEGAGGPGIFGQGFDASGVPLGGEFHANSFTAGAQQYPAVVGNGTNNFLVVWESGGEDGSGTGIFARRFSAAGLPADLAFMVNTYTTGYQSSPAAATDASGWFDVVWSGPGAGDSAGIFGQRFNQAGSTVGNEFLVNTYTTGLQQRPAVAADGIGNFIVVWADGGRDGSSYGVFGQRFDSVGTPLGGDFQVNTYTPQAQREPAVAADSVGNFVVTWISYGQDGSNWGVFGQRFNSLGARVGPEFRVNGYTTSSQFISSIAAHGAGDFVITWSGAGPSDIGDVLAQRFDAAGNRVGSELVVNAFTAGGQAAPAVTARAAGDFVVAWESYGQDGSSLGVFARQMVPKVFGHGFETFPPFWSATTADMCAGHCDSQSPSGCFCDSLCPGNFDCCLDACTTCGYCGP